MYRLALLLVCLLPASAYAGTTLNSIIAAGTNSLQLFVTVFMGIAMLVFIWGMVKFVAADGDDKSIAEGKQRMIWGIVALFLVVSVWGIVTILMTLFGVSTFNNNRCDPTTIDVQGGTVRTCT